MADSINTKAKEYYDSDNSGGSLNSNLKDFLKDQGVEGNSLNTMWRNYAKDNGFHSLNSRLSDLWGTSGSIISRWHNQLGLVWDNLKLFFDFRNQNTKPTHLLAGSTEFDGTDDYVDCGDDTSLDITSAITLSCWVKPDVVNDTVNLVGRDDGTNRNFYFYLDSGNALVYWYLHLDGTQVETVSTTSMVAGEWMHICGTYDGSNQKLYINGTLEDDDAETGSIDNDDVSFTIGAREAGADRHFDGSIANVSIHSSALTQSQIQSIMWKNYADLSTSETTNLVSWWALDDTSLGSEMVSNGDFATGDFTDWDSSGNGWSVSSGVATFAYTTEGNSKLIQNIGLADNKTYKLTFDYTCTSGSFTVRVYDGGYVTLGTYSSASDSVELDFLNTGNDGRLILTAVSTTFAGTIDNVSVKEIKLEDLEGTNDGSISGATTNTTPYGGNSPIKPRIQDNSPDALKNYGTIYSGTALSFDGVNDKVSLSSNPISNTSSTDWSISMWVNQNTTSGTFDRAFASIIDSNNYMMLLWTNHSSEGWVFSIGDSGTQYNVGFDEGNSTLSGQWFHIVGVWDSSEDTVKIYKNGKEQNNAYGGQAFTGGSTAGATIGVRPDNIGYIDSKLSSPKLFNTVLTEAQVQELYLNPEQILPTGVSSSNLKLWLPLTEGSGTTTYDGSGNQNHGTITGATWDTGNTDIYQTALVRQNKPMVFDGSDDVINTGDTFQSTFRDSFSISLWAKPDDGHPSGNQMLFGAYTTDNSDGIQMYLDSSPAGALHANYKSNGNNATGAETDNAIFADGATEWTHIVLIVQSSGMSIYANGSSQALDSTNNGSMTGVTMGDYTTDQNLRIGARVYSGSESVFFDGLINEVAIWDTALDADAVTALYNSGTPLDPTSDSGNYDNSDDLQGYWRNDGISTWTDRSTNSNNGTASGSPSTFLLPEGNTAGRDSQGFYLTDTTEIKDGVRLNGNDVVRVIDSSQAPSDLQSLSDNLTIECWVKANAVSGNETGSYVSYYTIAEMRTETSSGTHIPFSLGVNNSKISFGVTDNHTTSDERIDGTTSISTDTWYHVAVTMSGDDYVIYLNGSSDKSGTLSTATGDRSVGTTTSNFFIGSRTDNSGGSTSYFDGLVDEVRLYNQALTSAEITKNYNHSKSKHS